MDHLGLFQGKLCFIWWFYNEGVEPFIEIKRKIKVLEEPYVLRGGPENYDGEPPFLEEWQRADLAVNLVGQSCLGILVQSLKEYLYGHKEMLINLYGMNGGLELSGTSRGWFNKYREFYGRNGFDWGLSPVGLDFIEHMILTRNDIQHYLSNWDLNRRQSEQHLKKHPSGVFVNEIDIAINARVGPEVQESGRISIDKAKLRHAMDEVDRFVCFIEGGCKPVGEALCFPQWDRECLSEQDAAPSG